MEVKQKKPIKQASRKQKRSATASTRPQRKKQGELIFSLDIGTRNVVGIVGNEVDGVFHILECVSISHSKRAMVDGQIEEIDEVARVVKKVKDELEKRLRVALTHVSIAAAGRALKTQHVIMELDVPTTDPITSEMQKSFEIEAVSQAQAEIDKQQNADDVISFYCVGHSVISYQLDGYPIKSVVGHKGKKVLIDVIAAFLPSIVVESLYAVTDKNQLSVASLTLEPIAAMNVIIPPEVRLINIALVDIGAGTSDIAVSRNGSVVAYAMATTAGDEITEEIIKHFLVDFEMAEQMKLSAKSSEIAYRDILGIEHTVDSTEFFKAIYPAIDVLADTIVQNIINVNGVSPAAIFLVGGGSLIPDLPKIIAQKLDVPETRVAVGGHSFIKNIVIGNTQLNGPEYVTPIGIGVTATMQSGYDFSTIILNERKFRVFDTKSMNALDLLMIAGFKTRQIIGHTGKNLAFSLNGEQMQFKGTISTPCQLMINGIPSSIESPIKHGDRVSFIPALNGISAEAKISDIAGDVSPKYITLDGTPYEFGTCAVVNGRVVDSNYQIQSNDEVVITSISKLSELIKAISFDSQGFKFQKGKVILNSEYFLCDGDSIVSVRFEPKISEPVLASPAPASIGENFTSTMPPQAQPATASPPQPEFTPAMNIFLNGQRMTLPEKGDSSPHLFLEIFTLIDLDLSSPQGNLIMTINGVSAQYTSRLAENDSIQIYFG